MIQQLKSGILLASFAFIMLTEANASNDIMITSPLSIDGNSESVASISNSEIRLSYKKCGEGNKALGACMEARVDGRWQQFLSPAEDNKIFVITGPSKSKRPDYKQYYPGWKSADSISNNPYLAGSVCEAIPVKVRNKDKNSLEVEYVTSGNHKVTGTWSLSNSGCSFDLNLEFTPSADGCYSLGVMGAHAALPTQVTNVLLPPMYQYQRLPAQPQMLLSVMMPTPVAMVETQSGSGSKMTAFVSGDDTTFPLDWGGVDYSPMGFSLKNHANLVEAVAFSPVIGMSDCEMKASVPVKRKFVVGLTSNGWNETLEHVVSDIYRVKDYRHQPDRSLTETIFSIIDLMNNKDFGGWDDSMRGFYDIEGKPTKAPTVVHSAPLAVIAAAINGADEEMYLKRALPTIEYTLSRKGYRWSTRTTDDGYNKDPETLRLSPFGSQFTTTYYEGLNRLLGNKNAWIRDIAMPNDTIRICRGYSTPILSWVQSLYAYRLTGDEKWLRRARSTAERDAKMHIFTNSPKPQRYQAFYNSTIYAPWWDFLDLYETTHDKQFLEAARYGAAHTIAGIRTWPAVKDSVMTVHPGGEYNGNTTMWWKGSEQFRLGFPRVDGDAPEHEVEQWRVSPVGLGFEQPSTYFLRNKGKVVRPVFMSSWAPSLLRLNQHTGYNLYDTYARNAVIGRFSNYPGYYATGFTDLTMSPDFPYTGPDVSSIYYHHIPPHLSFCTDYLVSEMIQRSEGKINFPYGKQEGFVWFSNRVFGGVPGSVFDDNNVMLWMKKGLVNVSNSEINYLTAVSDSRLWILLANESHNSQTFTLNYGDEIYSIADPSSASVTTNKKKQKLSVEDGKINLEIQPKGFCAVSIPLNSDALSNNSSLKTLLASSEIPVLKNGYKIIDSGTPAGKIYLFRIRSPYGWDSVYGFCETPPCDNLKVSVRCGDQHPSRDIYPYEWSFSKFEYKQKVALTVEIESTDGATKTIDMEI